LSTQTNCPRYDPDKPTCQNHCDEVLVEIYKKQSFDLAFVDLQMPRMDGFEATREIRQYEKAAGIHTPILACSAHALPGDRAKSLAAGLDDHVTKPITRAVLAAAVENWVRPGKRRRSFVTSAG
jgi:CheY-like chemotaxis protein